MVVVAIIGILAAVAIPAFLSYMKKAKTSESMLQLNKLGKNAKSHFSTGTSYPQGTAKVLPGDDGGACTGPGGKFATTDEWSSEPIWVDLGFQIDDPSLFSYHYESGSRTSALATAVGDLDCDKTLVTYTLSLGVADGLPTAIITPPPANTD